MKNSPFCKKKRRVERRNGDRIKLDIKMCEGKNGSAVTFFLNNMRNKRKKERVGGRKGALLRVLKGMN